MLKVDGLKTRHVGPLSFDVTAGECVAIVGKSGEGKSLILRALADLDKSEGVVHLNGVEKSALSAPQWRKKISFIPATSAWWSEVVSDHFDCPPESVAPYLEKLGLGEALGWEVDRLSTGEKQRLALVRGLQNKPSVLLLDEPTASLDTVTTKAVEALLSDLKADNRAILLVSHDMAQVKRLSERWFELSAGQLHPLLGPLS